MREITTKVYTFNELTEEAKARAIEDHKEHMMEHESYDALLWAIDDCALFEPPHKEMANLLGEDYYDENKSPSGYSQFVFKNNRKGIVADLDSGDLSIADALEITNEGMFLKWLGLPHEMHDRVLWSIDDTSGGTRLDIDYKDEVFEDDSISVDPDDPAFQAARDKFADHMNNILDRIQAGYDEYFSEENVEERVSEGYEFEEDGAKF